MISLRTGFLTTTTTCADAQVYLMSNPTQLMYCFIERRRIRILVVDDFS